ncbi:MAG: right-handed parallel beta-helix repeat-containing protein [Spirochaetales bacterium]|nr:right-handed parallel beta-helix repeat-containing protein [Spirochaetales bacterium]
MKKILFIIFIITNSFVFADRTNIIEMQDFNLNGTDDATDAFIDALSKVDNELKNIINIPKGVYNFYQNKNSLREYFISNHDQTNPRFTGLEIKGKTNLIIEGNGSQFIFHGRIIPFAILNSESIEIRNLSVDFSETQIIQFEVLENSGSTLTLRLVNGDKYDFRAGIPFFYGNGWEVTPGSAIAFDPASGQILQETSDVWFPFALAREIGKDTFKLALSNNKLKVGTMLAARSWERPAPGFFVSESKDIKFKEINLHYSEGMGLIAQMTKNIHLDGFNVKIKEGSKRVFTTQADATHFSGCSGIIISENSLYEAMMDDAINVHGTYLKVLLRLGGKKVIAKYMHPQAYGFAWGYDGDSVQFINPNTMDHHSGRNKIVRISPYRSKTIDGTKRFIIEFENEIPWELGLGHGIENLTQTPEVIFRNNIIRNNRARGALFSTPKRTIVEDNTFDHVAGTGILLCGDCNGWYETGACKEVIIRNNKFINCLTSNFQFTNAIISIYPEIPRLKKQKNYFHSGITIEGNYFKTFDRPILYAKSTENLIFRNNTIERSNDLPAFHWNDKVFFFEKCRNFLIDKNKFTNGFEFNPQSDVKLNICDDQSIIFN